MNTRIPDNGSNIFGRAQTSPGGEWSGWQPVAGYLTSIATVANADGRLESWGVNTLLPDSSANIFSRAQTSPGGEWAGWHGVPGYLTTLSVTANADGRLELLGANTHLPDQAWNIFSRCPDQPRRRVDLVAGSARLPHLGVARHERRRPPRGHRLQRPSCVGMGRVRPDAVVTRRRLVGLDRRRRLSHVLIPTSVPNAGFPS